MRRRNGSNRSPDLAAPKRPHSIQRERLDLERRQDRPHHRGAPEVGRPLARAATRRQPRNPPANASPAPVGIEDAAQRKRREREHVVLRRTRARRARPRLTTTVFGPSRADRVRRLHQVALPVNWRISASLMNCTSTRRERRARARRASRRSRSSWCRRRRASGRLDARRGRATGGPGRCWRGRRSASLDQPSGRTRVESGEDVELRLEGLGVVEVVAVLPAPAEGLPAGTRHESAEIDCGARGTAPAARRRSPRRSPRRGGPARRTTRPWRNATPSPPRRSFPDPEGVSHRIERDRADHQDGHVAS